MHGRAHKMSGTGYRCLSLSISLPTEMKGALWEKKKYEKQQKGQTEKRELE